AGQGVIGYAGSMRKLGWLGVILAGIVAGYAVLLVVLGAVLDGVVAERVRARMAAALDAEVTIGGVEVSLLGGFVELRDVRVVRASGGHLELGIEEIGVRVAPLGWAVIRREPGEV